MNKKAIALLILKEAKDYKNIKIRKRQQEYFKPYKKQNKPWADIAVEYSVEFIEVLEKILKKYKKSCLDIIQNSKKLFKKNIIAKRDYRTNEYLDERYNHVVVPDIKDKLLELNNSFKESLENAYEKYILKGLINDAVGLVYKGMEMDFDFNKFDENTRDYLRDKKIKWANKVADTTERGIKNQLVDGYEQGLSSYDIASNINQSSNFGFRRCETIARTEIISSCNYADYEAFLENPNVIGLKWSSSGDDRVRATHKAADRQIRKKIKKGNHYELEKPFKVGNSSLKYPGDNSLGAEAKEVINCRCTLYPVFRGESLESNTIYDEPDANTEQWVSRQDEIFQNDYNGRETKNDEEAKKALYYKGFISKDNYNKKTLKQIKKDIDIRMQKNFKKLEVQKAFEGLHPIVKNIIKEQLSDILSFGLQSNKENLCALSIANFLNGEYRRTNSLKLFDNIIANEQNQRKENGELDENLILRFTDKNINTIDSQPENSVILIHNHPGGITLSLQDIIMLLKHSSIKYVIAVGHTGEIYAAKNDNRKYSFTDIQWEIQFKIMQNYQNKLLEKMKMDSIENLFDAYENSLKTVLMYYDNNICYYTSRTRR